MEEDTPAFDLDEVARTLATENSYLTLATVGASGVPWASPVWFAARDLDVFVWASKPGARHPLNIVENPQVSLVIFDSSKAPGTGSALYVTADAAQVDDASLDHMLAIYNDRSVEHGLSVWASAQLRSMRP